MTKFLMNLISTTTIVSDLIISQLTRKLIFIIMYIYFDKFQVIVDMTKYQGMHAYKLFSNNFLLGLCAINYWPFVDANIYYTFSLIYITVQKVDGRTIYAREFCSTNPIQSMVCNLMDSQPTCTYDISWTLGLICNMKRTLLR